MSETTTATPPADSDATSNDPASSKDTKLPPITSRPRPLTWVSGLAVLYVVAVLVDQLLNNPRWHWDVVSEYLFHDLILAGLGRTLYLTAASSVFGLALGMIFAAMRLSSNKIARTIAFLYIWFIRAIPTLVLLLLIFFLAALFPRIGLGIPFGPPIITFETNSLINASSAAILGLGIYLGGYSAEIFRGAILSVPQGQYDASKALGMPTSLMMRRQIIPQAVRVMIPALANELITMFKSTALVTVIGYTELLTTAQLIYSRNFQTIPLLTVACIWYLLITSVAMYGQQRLEEHYSRGFNQTPARRKAKVSRKTVPEVPGPRNEA